MLRICELYSITACDDGASDEDATQGASGGPHGNGDGDGCKPQHALLRCWSWHPFR